MYLSFKNFLKLSLYLGVPPPPPPPPPAFGVPPGPPPPAFAVPPGPPSQTEQQENLQTVSKDPRYAKFFKMINVVSVKK